MRFSPLALALVMAPTLALAQDPGVALNMSRGLNNGMGLGWTFKENWTLQPTLGLGYSDATGFEASVGSTVLRSFNLGERFYAYLGAGVYYASANGAYVRTPTSPAPVGGGPLPTEANGLTNQSYDDLVYLTTPAGVRARIFGNFEAFVEAAYQHALSGEFVPNQSGQFYSGNPSSRLGASLGISLRLN